MATLTKIIVSTNSTLIAKVIFVSVAMKSAWSLKFYDWIISSLSTRFKFLKLSLTLALQILPSQEISITNLYLFRRYTIRFLIKFSPWRKILWKFAKKSLKSQIYEKVSSLLQDWLRWLFFHKNTKIRPEKKLQQWLDNFELLVSSYNQA